MAWLALAALIWIGVHIGIAGGSPRGIIVRRIGEPGFQTAFSVASVVTIALLIFAYRRAPYIGVWVAPDWLRWILLAVMVVAFMLFLCAALARNPTSIGGGSALRTAPRGIVRVTRHPMLWSFALWAGVHIAGNGDAASFMFFGAFLLTALAGMSSIDAKLARRDPEGWRGFAAITSILPFGAIAAGRNRLVPEEIGWIPVVAGLAVWAAVAWAHPWLFGVAAVPG
jgi:uncharacterized membrane protein